MPGPDVRARRCQVFLTEWTEMQVYVSSFSTLPPGPLSSLRARALRSSGADAACATLRPQRQNPRGRSPGRLR
eukprot:1015651-Rhodomonas_salina.2